MPFSPEYVRLVLRENFEDARARFLAPLMAVHEAHLVMLTEQGIVSREDARAIGAALAAVDLDRIRQVAYDPSAEDLFFHVDRLIAEGCGPDVAGRLHTARSRNDIDMTMYRLWLRECLLAVAAATLALRRTLSGLADKHRSTVFAAHTHTQPAQPTTVAHYLLAVIERLERDGGRLLQAFGTVNRCPLGACAITGSGFPISRDRTSALLGFDGPTGNTYGSIASVDYLLESSSAVATTLVGVGRFVQDLLFWCTAEMGYLRLPEGFVQISSIMPQKRNPVALEHARALASKALAEAGAIPAVVHNTPFGDIVDTEDDLQPLVASAFRDAARALELVAASLTEAEFDAERMRARAGQKWVTATEVADTLARDHGIPFMTAHAIVGQVAREVPAAGPEQVARALEDRAAARGLTIRLSVEQVADALSAERFISLRKAPGGPAPEATAAALAMVRQNLSQDTGRLSQIRARLDEAELGRRQAVAAL